MNLDEIRQRLAAVEGIDWSTVKRETKQEYYGDWIRLGPLIMSAAEHHDAEITEQHSVAVFLQHAATDLRRLLTDLDHATTTREAVMPTDNPVYGPPNPGEPVRLLADAVEVVRPNGTTVTMDLVALADAAIRAERSVAGLREEIRTLSDRIGALENQATRTARGARIMAGETYEGELGDDLHDRVRDLEQVVARRAQYEQEMRARSDG